MLVLRTLGFALLALASACACGRDRSRVGGGGSTGPDTTHTPTDAGVVPVAPTEWRCDDECPLEEMERGCNADVPRACNLLGVAYNRGHLVPKDRARAAELWDGACTAGFARACFNLAGHHGHENIDAWLPLMTRGCELGDGLPCERIGEAYLYGQLGPVDHERSVEFYTRACNLDREDACFVVAEAYRVGRGVAPDPERAEALATQVCTKHPKHALCKRRP